MTDPELSDLEQAARAATPGPWAHGKNAVLWMGDDKNKHFVAKASPAAILELIADYRQTKRERDWLASAIGLGMVSNCEDKTFDEILQMARDAIRH